MQELAYYEIVDIENTKKIKKLVDEQMPAFCWQFFIGIEPNTSSRTRLVYAYDMVCFFEFLKSTRDDVKNADLKTLEPDILDTVSAQNIEEYLYWIKIYEKDGRTIINGETGIKRKLSALRSFYNYFYKKEIINTNPPLKVDMPKIHDKPIVRLDPDEIEKFLWEVESGENLSANQRSAHEKTKVRDLAMLMLMLGTGIRVSECVGLDLNDVDLKNNGIKVHRKGGDEAVIYFNAEVRDALWMYLKERKGLIPEEGHKNALFLSLDGYRMSTRSVENMVKKYTKLVTTLKTITPHKLRSTYGTNLYKETADIYLVADVLGHKNVETTRRHYAAMEDTRRKEAATKVHIRQKQTLKKGKKSKEELLEEIEEQQRHLLSAKLMLSHIITELGVPTEKDATFERIAENIEALAKKKYKEGYEIGVEKGKAEKEYKE